MPKDKDLKRLVRARMAKTGESYTTARSHIVGRRSPPVAEYAELAGTSNDTVRAKTGKDWPGWVRALDAIEAVTLTHRDIAKHVLDHYDVSAWWAQTVTVGYERIRGLRAKGQRRDRGKPGLFEISKSKTFPVPVDVLYGAFATKRTRLRWLPEAGLEIRTSRKNRSMRMVWPGGTLVNASFVTKGDAKSAVQVMHTKLPDMRTGEVLRAYWGERLNELAELLG